MHQQKEYFEKYIQYINETECPIFYHRWCSLGVISTILGRRFYFQHGHFTVNPNMYVMLIGTPGTRKTTAVKIAQKLVAETGFKYFAAEKTSKEKFLLDLGEQNGYDDTGEDVLEANLWGNDDVNYETREPAELLIAADEFNNFIGNGNMEFISLLGSLWDYSGVYENRIKGGKSVKIPNPTINILAGNTPTGFALAFPPDVLGQGFFSRLLLIYGEPTGKKITFPEPPCPQMRLELVARLDQIKATCVGPASITPEAKHLLDKIYKSYESLEDIRFESYCQRRFTHLLKLCLITSASRISKEISSDDVIYANTILTHTEHLMPKALGEFGKSRYSDVSHKIMALLDRATKPVTPKEIIQAVHQDVDGVHVVVDILKGLATADKVFTIDGGYLPKRKARKESGSDLFDAGVLTAEELDY